ncbi:hypothetical protein A0J61_03195 [Choanephora cucurbitarum]|uniref:Uncharacterized protein n=1 Tax=Choanephora cucurbitarum TaxID=101091 RepID=A0A1C7NI79_9FUNG|nr:hypothetical protein A0J61_03195 [Choanephora cucurbitarum]
MSKKIWPSGTVRNTWTMNKPERNYPRTGKIPSFSRQSSSTLLALAPQYCNKDILPFENKNSDSIAFKDYYNTLIFENHLWKKTKIITLAQTVDPHLYSCLEKLLLE